MNERDTTERIEERLQDLARHFSYPSTPDVAEAVRVRLAAERKRPGLTARPFTGYAVARRRVGWLALAAVLLALSAALLVPEVGTAIRAFLRIGSVEVIVGTPTPNPIGTPNSLWDPDLTGATTLSEAQAQLSFPIKLPAYPEDLGAPNRVYKQRLGGQAVILGWADPADPRRARLVLHQLTSDLMARKWISDDSVLERARVHGEEALWVRGPHLVEFYNPGGSEGPDFGPRQLVEGNVLIWTEGQITYRLETVSSLQEAVRIAESLR